MARKYHNHTLLTDTLHRGKRHRALTVTWHLKQFLATISLFPNEKVAKLEMTLSTAQQNKDQIQKPTNNRSNNKQWINNNIRIDLERSVEDTGGLN